MVGDLADIIQRSKELCDDNMECRTNGDDDVAVNMQNVTVEFCK
jgi:hypothetical protein